MYCLFQLPKCDDRVSLHLSVPLCVPVEEGVLQFVQQLYIRFLTRTYVIGLWRVIWEVLHKFLTHNGGKDRMEYAGRGRREK